jgi:hypothetical protein
MRIPLGRQAKLSYSAAGVTFTEAKKVADVSLNLGKTEDDDTTRESDGWETSAGTMKQAALEFNYKSDGSDAFFLLLQDSYVNNTPIRMRADSAGTGLDNGPTFTAWCEVFSMNRTENLKELVKYQVSMKPTCPPVGSEAETPTFIAAEET